MQKLHTLLKLLIHSPLDFVLVGGFAAVLHGCNQTTRDIDICILYSPEQVDLLRSLLKPYHPRHRTNESRPSFLETPKELSQKQDFHLITDLGPLDIISRIKGVGDYLDILKNSEEMELYGGACRVISIEDLVKSKKSLGGHKDLATVQELEAILEEKKQM